MQSMTGYGRGLICEDGREMTVEVKSVNHRFLDVSFRLARPIAFLDDAVRTGIAARLARGHVDVFVNYVNHREDAHRVHVDTQLARTYQQAAGELSDALGMKNDLPLSEYIHMPDVLTVEASEEDQDAVRDLFMRALNLALDGLIAMRAREGDSLRSDMMTKLDAIDALRSQIATRAPLVVEEYRTKLNQRLSALLGGEIDEARFATEVAIFADRAAIDEELGSPEQPYCAASCNGGAGRSGRQKTRLSGAGAEPRGQHHRLEGLRHADCRMRGRGEGRN